jgi:hypothetical protein
MAEQTRQIRRLWAHAAAAALAWCPLAALIVGVVGAALAADVSAWLRPARGGWVVSGVTSEGFVRAGMILLACGGLAAGLCRALWRLGLPLRPARPARVQSGVEMLEFAILLPFMLMIVLIMIQTSLLMGGMLSVHYSAFCAARSAVVMVPENLPGELPNEVTPDADFGKLQRIRDAAAIAVMPVCAGSAEAPAGDAAAMQAGLNSVFGGYGKPTPGWTSMLPRKFQYAFDHTKVELAPPALNGIYAEHEDLVVTVRHDLYLAVPYAGNIFGMVAGGAKLPWGAGEWCSNIVATCRLPNEGTRDVIDIETFNLAP